MILLESLTEDIPQFHAFCLRQAASGHLSEYAQVWPYHSQSERKFPGVASHESLRSIPYQLGRAPSTISREVNRNDGDKKYSATQADQAAWDRARRPKPCRLAGNPTLIQTIADKLQLNWSPEQISGWLKREYPL